MDLVTVDEPLPPLEVVDLLVVGAPTHIHGLSSKRSREGAVDQGAAGEPGIGVRGWIDSLLSRLRRLLGALWWVLLVLPVVAAAYGAWKALGWWRRRRARPWATRCYERLSRAGRQRDRPRQPAETPAEYCDALATELPDDRLVRVGELLSVAAYSGREPPVEARAWADSVVRHVERSSPPRRRRVRSGKGLPG